MSASKPSSKHIVSNFFSLMIYFHIVFLFYLIESLVFNFFTFNLSSEISFFLMLVSLTYLIMLLKSSISLFLHYEFYTLYCYYLFHSCLLCLFHLWYYFLIISHLMCYLSQIIIYCFLRLYLLQIICSICFLLHCFYFSLLHTLFIYWYYFL